MDRFKKHDYLFEKLLHAATEVSDTGIHIALIRYDINNNICH
jgi:hypothetical protein